MYSLSDKPSCPTLEREDFLEMCQNFAIALNQNRIYRRKKDVKWGQWITYWSTISHRSICYSNCSGSCSDDCKGGSCFYYFPISEKDNQFLPDNEKTDAANIFDDNIFWIASLYYDFIKDYK